LPKLLSDAQVSAFRRDGFLFPIRVMPSDDAEMLRTELEAAERAQGGAFKGSLRHKPHLIFTWLDQTIRHPAILDAVEDILGPNLLVWASSFFIKEAHDPSYVSWHQDSTYWGLSEPDVVTAWVALSESSIESGAMRVIPGTHKEQVAHSDTFAENNLLTRGQEIAVEVDEDQAVDVVLHPGEMSLHHVRLFHGSPPNQSDDRRIGFAIRYIPTYVRQVNGPKDYAMLVRGVDEYGHFQLESPPKADLHPDAVALHKQVADDQAKILYAGTDRSGYR